MKRYLIKLAAICGLISLPFCFAQAESTETTPNYALLAKSLSYNTHLSPEAIEMAFAGNQWAIRHHKVANKELLTIVDFSLPSDRDRLYVINLTTGKIL